MCRASGVQRVEGQAYASEYILDSATGAAFDQHAVSVELLDAERRVLVVMCWALGKPAIDACPFHTIQAGQQPVGDHRDLPIGSASCAEASRARYSAGGSMM